METIKELLPFLIPLIIIQLALQITALIHAIKHPHYRFGNKVMWIIIIIFGEIFGAIIYFALGRGEE
jgi:hypothetical protein